MMVSKDSATSILSGGSANLCFDWFVDQLVTSFDLGLVLFLAPLAVGELLVKLAKDRHRVTDAFKVSLNLFHCFGNLFAPVFDLTGLASYQLDHLGLINYFHVSKLAD